jgi:DNA/RNA-binding domain of Phe-tRNA-synthetase-like protein
MSDANSPFEAEEPVFQFTSRWKTAYPQAHAGVLVLRDVVNPSRHAELERRKAALELELRARYAGQDRKALQENPVLQAYGSHYRRFNKTYHVQLQLESLALKGKPMPSVSALVDAMFMAEMSSLLLTAGHDLGAAQVPLTLDVALGTESYVLLRGEPQSPKAGDMMIVDGKGIISSIIYGPDRRTQITAQTRDAVFTVYAPAGISEHIIEQHLEKIVSNVQVIAPNTKMDLLRVYS